MRVERSKRGVLRITAHTSELAALVAAARWVVSDEPSRPTPSAQAHLRRVLASYDRALTMLTQPSATSRGL